MDVESLLRTLADPGEPTGGDSGRTFVEIMQDADEDPWERRRIQRLADLLDVEDALYAQALEHLAAGDDHAAEPLLRLAAEAAGGEAEDHLARVLADRAADAAPAEAGDGTPQPGDTGGRSPAPGRSEQTSAARGPDDLFLPSGHPRPEGEGTPELLPASRWTSWVKAELAGRLVNPVGVEHHPGVCDDLGLRFRYSTVTILTVDLQEFSLPRAQAPRSCSFRPHTDRPSAHVVWAEEMAALGACTFDSRFVLVPPARDLQPIDQQIRRIDRVSRPAARTVIDVMRNDVPVPVISAGTTVHAALERMFAAEAHVAAVEAGSELVGVIRLSTLAQRLAATQGSPSIERITGLIHPADFVPPDAPLDAARRTLARDPGGIVVVRGRDGRRLGYVTAELLLTSPDQDNGPANHTLDQPGTVTPILFPSRSLPARIGRRATAT
ncbi:CBS domain-containing protein [Frankia sp. AiPs1]|uniref:CBS domain-containing protein n=1 Tax=Frankia sp. AiPs1 TaxID=573493 RepID=UPI0020440F0F|nr:CBS domain-containing protein [Frankia sp. AiPs1]MCM3922126.1 CBS domain-containing protein [Frankia sp. AiPs1]